jgi:type II restriction/modification system DNA methylase subunit YeeA
MPISWNEIRQRAIAFSREWADTHNEDAEAKPFLEAFLQVFDISRRKFATFEHRVKKLDDKDGYIDLLWKSVMLVEMKSRGKDLQKAFEQAKAYCQNLPQHELPRMILVSDFAEFVLHDMEDQTEHRFALHEFHKNIEHFGFLLGYTRKVYKEQDPANIKAAELMGKLHDRLKEIGYEGHPLEVYLVRILFCLFAEDTSIFKRQQFQDYLEQRTNKDGSDLAARLQELFQVLNTPAKNRFKNLDEDLAAFPYINGKLFEEMLPMASFDSAMRTALINCCYIDWSKISPAIFGSMFQSVMNPKERRNLGAHYTSEKNILKLIKPLFLDELYEEFEKIKTQKNKLKQFHQKLANLRFLDPACGCGNFLVITYRELRMLELQVLKALYGTQQVTDLEQLILVDVDRFYGIEYEEFPAQIAQVAMWLIDHQMNMQISTAFGDYVARIPLRKAATIIHGNALQVDWTDLIKQHLLPFDNKSNLYELNEPPETYVKSKRGEKVNEVVFNYIIGNPPFIGKSMQNAAQKTDMELIFKDVKGAGVLDYVSAWYVKAAQYMRYVSNKYGIELSDKNTHGFTKCAFVSTNSITQGEQVGILWNELFKKYKIKIHFAHRTFQWNNEAKGNAAVHCVIVGFANFDTIRPKLIYEYQDIKSEPTEIQAKNINPYLIEGSDTFIDKRSKPICNAPEINRGNMPNDDGNLILFNEDELNDYLKIEPNGKKWIRKYIGADDFINNKKRFCFWLLDAEPNELKQLPELLKRIENVKQYRLSSPRETTNKLAQTPALFAEIRQPKKDYLVIPSVSSERRTYIPIGYEISTTIPNTDVMLIEVDSKYVLGVMLSIMHMTWAKNTCGRMKSDYRYSNGIVYNNFPWPESPTEKQKQAVEQAAQQVLDARAQFPNSSLADLYDPLTMPPALVKAHQQLDKAVDQCYRSAPFTSEAKRMEFLFELYEKYTAGLLAGEKKKTKKTK